MTASDEASGLDATRPNPAGSVVLIVDGAQQAAAVAEHAGSDCAVYAMAGAKGYLRAGSPDPELMATDDKDVVVFLRGEPAADLNIYNAAVGLAEACAAEGARSVRFARLPGGRRADVAEILGTRDATRRTAYLERLIKGAKAKPADTKPKAAKKRSATTPTVTPERGMVEVNGDRYEVIKALTTALLDKWDAERLFNYGGILAQRKAITMLPVTKDAFNGIVAETCMTVARTGDDPDEPKFVHTWPDPQTNGAILANADSFAPLDKLSQIPFIRADGTVCQTPGYDRDSHTFLVLADDLAGIRIPDEPTAEEIKAAADLLRGDLFVNFPFPTDADMANAIATLLTPFVRDLVPVSPLAVIDAKEKGSGKNLYADLISIIVSGRAVPPLPYTIDDSEHRKVITSAFRSGATLFVFDEAHSLGGASFARALTSHTYQDRLLGGNSMAEFPNNITWMSLGNKVQIFGDMGRRVYRVELSYQGESPEHRPKESFKHPALREWAAEHRAELITACLTLARAWFAAGRPEPDQAFNFGSFETWQKVVGGILHVAGIGGFLANVKEWRAESDFEHQHWVLHLQWLERTFSTGQFTCAMATERLRRDAQAEHPHGMTDTAIEGYPRLLGQEYAKQRDRLVEGLRLVKCEGKAHGNAAKWAVERERAVKLVPQSGLDEDATDAGGGGGNGGYPSTNVYEEKHVSNLTPDAPLHVSRVGGGISVSPLTPVAPAPGLFDDPETCPACHWPIDSNGHHLNCHGAAA